MSHLSWRSFRHTFPPNFGSPAHRNEGRGMRKIMRTASAIAFAAVAIMATATASASAATASASAATYQGCSPGYVCIYPENAGWNGGQPSHTYYRYGAHNLSGQYGIHRLFNNQTGGAGAYACTGYNGGGQCWRLNTNNYWDINLTPINSIVLTPY
jgi:hypothetical protein